MRSFRLNDEARAEFDAEAAWYEAARAGLGLEFIAAVDHVLGRIEHTDEFATAPIARFPGFVVRRKFVERFPYLVMFVENEALGRVAMIRHRKSDPAIWRSRV